MSKEILITAEYFKEYRNRLGFTSQGDVKKFFGAKDINPSIDLQYIELLNERLLEMIKKINKVIPKNIRVNDLKNFKKEFIEHPFKIIKLNHILPRLNNQGRRPEEVYFSWMRGFVVSNFFLKALSLVFEVNISNIDLIGDDDLKNIEIFKRTPTADLEININSKKKIRIEMQSGFTGINDIKQHKVLEAKRVFEKSRIHTLAIHFDLFNGQVAFVRLDEIDDDNVNWITRQQMEGQTVFNIEQNYFVWKLIKKPIKFSEIDFD